MNLHIQRDGQQYGHYSLEEARALLAEGKLLPGDLARPDGATDWKPLSTLPGFSTPPALPSSAPKRRRRMPRYVSIPLYLLGLLVVTFLIWRINLSVQISKRLAALKAAGYPISSAELDVYYKAVPETENAALLVMQAFEQLKPGDLKHEDADHILLRLLPRSTSLPVSLKERFSQQVEANRAALALLHEVGTRSKSRYPVDFTQGPYDDWEQISRITDCAKMLRKEAVLHTESSNPAAAAESIQAGLALARTLKYEPNVISQIVRIRANFFAYDGLERCVNQVNFTDPQLAALGTSLRESDETDTLSRAMIGERVDFIERVQGTAPVSENETEGQAASRDLWSLLRWSGWSGRELLLYLASLETNFVVGGRPESERLPLRDLNDAQMLRTRMDKTVAFASFFQHGTALIRFTANDSARLRVAETALAVERFRLAHQNQLPGSLAALIPAYLKSVPTDPFDGQPLRFKRLEKGYVVYCIGTDLQDDGGLEAKQDGERKWIRNQPFDITFTVER